MFEASNKEGQPLGTKCEQNTRQGKIFQFCNYLCLIFNIRRPFHIFCTWFSEYNIDKLTNKYVLFSKTSVRKIKWKAEVIGAQIRAGDEFGGDLMSASQD